MSQPRKLAWVLCPALALLPTTGQAQQALGIEAAPTRPVAQPGVGVADGPSAFGVTQNPASLGDLPALELGLRHTETATDSPFAGRGTGFYAAGPLPYLSRLQAHGALEILRPAAGTGLPDPPGVMARLTLGASAQLAPWFSLGLSYAHVFSSGFGDGVNTVDLGARARAGRFLAAGLVLRDVAGGHLSGAAPTYLQRVYELELLGRPLGDARFELAAGARLGESRGDVEPRLRLWIRPRAGLGLLAEGAVLLSSGPPGAPQPAWRVALGLQLDLAHVGVQAVGLLAGGTGLQGGGSAALRVSWDRYPALHESGARLVRINPGGLTGVAFLRLLQDLSRLARDRRVAGVAVMLSGGLKVGWGRADELRQALLRLRAAGKRVFVYAGALDTPAYYVATAAERIVLDPVGSVQVSGISQRIFNLKDSLESLGVRADLLRVGEYKSAPETFTASGPSAESRAEREALVGDLYGRLLSGVAAGRRLRAEEARALIDRGLYTPAAARRAGLVDEVGTGVEFERMLVQRAPGARLVSLAEPTRRPTSFAPRRVAVVNIDGDLVDGASRTVPLVDLRLAGSQTLVAALQRAALDPDVAAIVVRVESPGGSVGASEWLARVVQQIGRDKPVVCSFGDTAASGGYYLAAPCARIFTGAMTLTGSIGIFGGKVEAGRLLDRLGVKWTAVQRGAHADLDSPLRPYSDSERALKQEQLQAGYERFVEVVSAGRKLPQKRVDTLGRGRVYTGAQALDAGLCDQRGGLMDAVAEARRRAGLPEDADEDLVFYPAPEQSLLSRVLGGLLGLPLSQDSAAGLLGGLPRALYQLPALLLLQEGHLLARMEDEPPR